MGMSKDEKVLAQNSGFNRAESKRAQENLDKAREAREKGNDRAARSYEGKAKAQMGRVEKSSATMSGIIGKLFGG